MSKKRYGDVRLEKMGRDELLAYAKRITRDHGRAQDSINRLIGRVNELEAAQGEAAGQPHQFTPAPHQGEVITAPVRYKAHHVSAHRAHHRRMVLHDAGEARHE
jgi:hypothetical protein